MIQRKEENDKTERKEIGKQKRERQSLRRNSNKLKGAPPPPPPPHTHTPPPPPQSLTDRTVVQGLSGVNANCAKHQNPVIAAPPTLGPLCWATHTHFIDFCRSLQEARSICDRRTQSFAANAVYAWFHRGGRE